MTNNFLQVGRTNQCSKCHPEKGFLNCDLVFKEHGIKCECICHDQAIKAIKAKLERNDNPTLTPGLIYALTILEPFPQRQKNGINPLKQTVYKRLEKMKLKDMADKINEIVDEINRIKII